MADQPQDKPERVKGGGDGLSVPSYEAFLPEGATPEDVMRWVKELEAVSDQMEALLDRMTRRKRS